jgi:hypothetical protein
VGEPIFACSFRNVEYQFTWAFAGVYGPNSNCDRRLLWDELAGFLNWWNLSWCIEGDFNVTLFHSEKSGEVCFCPVMVEFSDFIFDQELINIPLVGETSTWSNNQAQPSWSIIDRFLVSP